MDGLDIVLDMVGGEYIPRNLGLLGTGGRHVSLAFQGGASVSDMGMMRVMLKRLTLTGSTLRSRSDAFKAELAQDVTAALALCEQHPLVPPQGSSQWTITPHQALEGDTATSPALAPMVNKVWDAHAVQDAHEALAAGAPGKHVLRW